MEENITLEKLFENIQEAYECACEGCEETECFLGDVARCLKPDIYGEEYCEYIAKKHFHSNWRNEQFVRSFLGHLLGLPDFELDETDKKELGPEVIGYACELFGPEPLHTYDILLSTLSLDSVADFVYEVLEKAYDLQSIADYEKAKEDGTLKTRPIEELFTELDL